MTKLVEVALPLEAISAASKRDKDKKTGTIKNVHKWFAPMPTPAWRALLFAALVDDPGDDAERAKLLDLVERLVPAHGGAPDDATLAEAKAVLAEATGGNPPTVYDPFCGGGSTLVEAQRLGLPAAGSDLNPVPTLITRVLTNLVPSVASRQALMGDPTQLKGMMGSPLEGLLADCRYYAERVREKVWDQVGHLYPEAPGGGTVVAWLWARTVRCPNPACRAITPLAASFWLSKKKGAETWVEPVPQGPGNPVRFEIRTGSGGPTKNGTKAGRGGTFVCAVCDEPVPERHVKDEGMHGRLGTQLMAVAVDRGRKRAYEPADGNEPPEVTCPDDVSDIPLSKDTRALWTQLYGLTTYADQFTDRQLTMLGAFSDAIAHIPNQVQTDGGDQAQATTIASILGLALGKLAMTNSTQARWYVGGSSGSTRVQAAFSRHALPMMWDYVELNPFSERSANWLGVVDSAFTGLRTLPASVPAMVFRADAREGAHQLGYPALVATDPPYFAHIGYADLSDYFYVWLRRALADVHPDLFATVATPKATELIAAPYRHGGIEAATRHFIDGFTETFGALASAAVPDVPMLIVYAHRQEESDDGDRSATAWDAMLSAILAAGLRIVMTWPIHATGSTRQIGLGTNALASYVVLVCRPKDPAAKTVDQQAFVSALRAELPRAVRHLQEGAISTIDLGQAALGAGMEVFTRFARVLTPAGKDMDVSTALGLISQVQGEILDEFVGNLDRETRWAMAWYRERGFDQGIFDEAEKLCRTTNTSLEGLQQAGIVAARAGKVRLVARHELADDWSPEDDDTPTVWELTQHLVKRLATGGEQAAASLLAQGGNVADDARDLAYWLSRQAVITGRAAEVLDYDALTTSWRVLVDLRDFAPEEPSGDEQGTLLQ